MIDAKTPPPAVTPSVTSRVVVGAGWMMAWRMVSRMLGFISVLILASLLEPADFGIVALATAVGASIDGLSQLGVKDALVRLADDRRDYYDTAFSVQAARGLLTGALIVGLSFFASDWMGEPRLRPILLVLAALAAVSGFENIGVVSFSRSLDFRTQFLLQAGPRLFGFVVTSALAFALHSYWALIAGGAIAKLSGVAASYVLSPHRPRFGTAGWRYLLHFSLWTWLGGLAIVVLQRSDAFLLAPVLGSAPFGLFVLATEIALLPITELLEPACTALFPGFAMARRQGTEPVTMGLSVAGALSLCTLPFSIGISATSGYLVTSLLGPQWEAARPVISVLAWMCVFLPFSWVTVTVLSAQGQVRRVFASHAFAACIKVAGILAVRQTLDLMLIAKVSVAIVAVESLLFIWQLRRAGSGELRDLSLTLGRAAVSAGMTCGVLGLLPGTWAHAGMDRVAALAAGAGVGAVTFATFFACQAALWHWAGRPAGGEARLVGLLDHNARLRALRARWA